MGKRKVTKEDKEWAKIVKARDDNQCVICGNEERLNAHHLIAWENKEFRFDKRNGISLCPSHHRFNFKLSAHQAPIAFIEWMKKNRPMQLAWVIRNTIYLNPGLL